MQNPQAIERLFGNIAMMLGASGGAIYYPYEGPANVRDPFVVQHIQDFRRDDFNFELNTMGTPDPMGYFDVPTSVLLNVFNSGRPEVLLHSDALTNNGCLSCVLPVKGEEGKVQFMMVFSSQLYNAYDIAADSAPGEKKRGAPRTNMASADMPPVKLAMPHDYIPDQLVSLSEFVLNHGPIFDAFGPDAEVGRVPYQEEVGLRLLEGIEERILDFFRGFSPQTAMHVERVRKLSDAFFTAINECTEGPYADVTLTPYDAARARLGAGLHDTGKMQVALSVTEFTGKYDDAYIAAMRAHTVLGQGMLDLPLNDAHGIAQVAGQHHDRPWQNGQVFTSDLVKIADMFDALTTPRTYKKVYFVGGQKKEAICAPVEDALAILFEMSQKDPPLVDPYALKFFTEMGVWRALGNPQNIHDIDNRYVLRANDRPIVGPLPRDGATLRDGMMPELLTQMMEAVAENMLNDIWERVRNNPMPSQTISDPNALKVIEDRIISSIGLPPPEYMEYIKKDPFFKVQESKPLPPQDLGVNGDLSGAGNLGAETRRSERLEKIEKRVDRERFKMKYEPARERDHLDGRGTHR